jgi:EF hand
MPSPVLFLVLLAAGAQQSQILVTGHAWAPFISPMGEPFRARTPDDDTLARWFNQADRNHDGALTPDELVADGDRFFATLDTNHDQEIDPEELVQYEWEIAPDIQLMSKKRPAPGLRSTNAPGGKEKAGRENLLDEGAGSLQGAARYGLLNMPEPVAAADANFDRGISLTEFRQAAFARFQLLDRAGAGRVSLADLEALRPSPTTDRGRKAKKDPLDARIGNPLPPGN